MWTSVALLLVAATLGVVPAPPASAGDVGATCTFRTEETSTPGLWLLVEGRTHNSATGSIACAGTIGGETLSPVPGTIRYDVDFTGTCAQGAGTGVVRLRLSAADDSPIVLDGRFTVRYAAGVGRVEGAYATGGYFQAAFTVATDPDHPGEDCVTKPLRHFVVAGQGVLR